jgi:hypothetical protein
MYEHRTEPLLPRRMFALRVARHTAVAFGIIGVSVAIGMVGYHNIEGLDWVDSFLNAAMIFSGEGPVEPLKTNAGKIFAGCYGLASVIILLASVGVLLAPAIHRGLHKFNLDVAAAAKHKLPARPGPLS